MPLLAVRPLPTIPDAPDLPIKSNSAALRNIRLLAPLHASSQQIHAHGAIVFDSAGVEPLEVNAVLERAVFHEALGRDVGEVFC